MKRKNTKGTTEITLAHIAANAYNARGTMHIEGHNVLNKRTETIPVTVYNTIECGTAVCTEIYLQKGITLTFNSLVTRPNE